MDDLFEMSSVARVDAYLDHEERPFQSIAPPDTVLIDTTALQDGPHVLRLEARDTSGRVGRRTIPFLVQNGPGITVTGLRPGERVGGPVQLQINAFGADEPFDPVRAESSGPIPVWTWVMSAVIAAWAAWYALEAFTVPSAYANTPTYSNNPVAAAQQPMQSNAPAPAGTGAVAGFNYAATGASSYTANCSSCHGASGAGIPGTFPPLAGDPVVTAKDPAEHVRIVLKGLQGKSIRGTAYASQMPSFSQLSDAEVAAIVDHERTSWGNSAPIVTPDVVKRAR